jgi:adenylate cyclase
MAKLTMEAPELERRLAAIVAADVEGYSRLMHGDEEATMAALSARRAVIDKLIAIHRGRIANTAGDSVLAEFASVLDAVSCAVEIQQAMAKANETESDRAMRFRIGINVGDVMVKDGDIFGDGVNVAARLEGLADGGGICVSRGVHDHLHNRAKFTFEDLGEQLVKNIAHPVRAYRLHLGDRTPEFASDAALPAELERSEDNEVALELALWESVKDGGAAELASYLEHYPEGTFASLARTRQSVAPDDQASPPPQPLPAYQEATPDTLDLAFWDAIKESQAPEELTAYLEQHPNGHFSGLARARLSQPEDTRSNETPSRQVQADAMELSFWESICDAKDPHLLVAYLEKYPAGEFTVIAQSRLAALRSGGTEEAQSKD